MIQNVAGWHFASARTVWNGREKTEKNQFRTTIYRRHKVRIVEKRKDLCRNRPKKCDKTEINQTSDSNGIDKFNNQSKVVSFNKISIWKSFAVPFPILFLLLAIHIQMWTRMWMYDVRRNCGNQSHCRSVFRRSMDSAIRYYLFWLCSESFRFIHSKAAATKRIYVGMELFHVYWPLSHEMHLNHQFSCIHRCQ